MRKLVLVSIFTLTSAVAFNFGSLVEGVTNSLSDTETSKSSQTGLTNSTVSSGLKEALHVGVDYAVKELGKNNGYLNNSLVKIALPENLSKAEGMIRAAGGDKVADDLIASMNKAATQAAPKTASIFANAIDKMSLEDAKNILAGDENAATNYFKTNTTGSLKKMITPIIQESMKENSVASYYDSFNGLYKTYGKGLVESTGVMGYAKNFGVDSYLPSSSDENLDEYVTQKAIDGLFDMIAQKEALIRKNPIEQTTSLLKQVFGN